MKTNTNTKTFSQVSDNPFANPIHAKIAVMDAVVVNHDTLNQAIKGLKDCISWSEYSTEPRGAVITGVGGTGKTTICNAILKMFPTHEIIEDRTIVKIVPAFYASVPSPSTIKSLAENLLTCLGDPTPLKGNASTLTARLGKLLKVCKTKIILLDEFHHLLAEASVGDARSMKICNWLKSLINSSGVMVCLVGIPTCEALVNHDSQMARRFTHRFKLGELSVGTKEEPGPLKKFLLAIASEFKTRLGLDEFINFHQHEKVLQMWAATSGNPAFILILLKEATAIAMKAGRQAVCQSDLAEAYGKGITHEVSKISGNPFSMTASQMALKINPTKVN